MMKDGRRGERIEEGGGCRKNGRERGWNKEKATGGKEDKNWRRRRA